MSCTEIKLTFSIIACLWVVELDHTHMTCKFLKNVLLYSGYEIPRGLKYAISKYGNMRKRYISLLLLPGLTETFLKEQERP